MKENQLLLNTYYYITTIIALNLSQWPVRCGFSCLVCRWGNWGLEELTDLAKFSELVNDRAQIQQFGIRSTFSMLCTSDLLSDLEWGVGAPRNLCQTLACLYLHPLLTLHLTPSVSQWDWAMRVACNSNRHLCQLASNWICHWVTLEGGWRGRRENLGIFPLPVHPWWWEVPPSPLWSSSRKAHCGSRFFQVTLPATFHP